MNISHLDHLVLTVADLRDPDQNLIELSNPLENPLEPNA